MNRFLIRSIAAAFACNLAAVTWLGAAEEPVTLPADQPMNDLLAPVPTLRAASVDATKTQALEWLSAANPDPSVKEKAEKIWAEGAAAPDSADLLQRLADTLALGDERVRTLVELCGRGEPPVPLPSQDWLKEQNLAPFARDHLRLLYGRWLSQQFLYDEALDQLKDLDPAQVVDPASLLFYQAVGRHRLLDKKEGLAAVDRLLSDVEGAPQRYVVLAGLMREDLKSLEENSLDHIARRMDDIRRRLALARAGQQVRTIEDGVIASLDKMIEDLEKQQQEQQQQQSSNGNNNSPNQQPSTPLPDSRLIGANGAGKVNRRALGKTAGWGDLPPKQREQALQQIGKDFPSHYRDIVEQYFKKLATEEGQP